MYGRLLFLDIVLRLENSLLSTLVLSTRSLVFLEISDCMKHIETFEFYLSLAEGTHSWCSFLRYWKDFRRHFRCEYPIKCLKHPIKSLRTEFDFRHINNKVFWIEIVNSLRHSAEPHPSLWSSPWFSISWCSVEFCRCLICYHLKQPLSKRYQLLASEIRIWWLYMIPRVSSVQPELGGKLLYIFGIWGPQFQNVVRILSP